jgi:hypothetical protein
VRQHRAKDEKRESRPRFSFLGFNTQGATPTTMPQPRETTPMLKPALRSATAGAVLGAILITAGCGNPPEDVRITLCKDIAAVRSGGPISISAAEAQTKGYQHAAVRVRYNSGGTDGEVVCYYDYNAVEHTAQNLADPLSAYSTSPTRVTVGGRPLSRAQLADAIKRAMMKQGREAIDRAKGAVQQAIGQ